MPLELSINFGDSCMILLYAGDILITTRDVRQARSCTGKHIGNHLLLRSGSAKNYVIPNGIFNNSHNPYSFNVDLPLFLRISMITTDSPWTPRLVFQQLLGRLLGY